MRRLGAILAGGRSSRFGCDKAEFLADGVALLDHVAAALSPHVAHIAVIGREWPGFTSIADRPAPGLGPLGGLCGALNFAAAHDFDGVVLAGCDTLPLPLSMVLGDQVPIVIAEQPLIGWWPVSLAVRLDDWLNASDNRAVYKWIDAVAAQRVAAPEHIFNLNAPRDVMLWLESRADPT